MKTIHFLALLVGMPARFRGLDDLLLLTLGGVDRGVALAFRGEDHRALLALGAHLLFHGRDDVRGGLDVLDLVAQDLVIF